MDDKLMEINSEARELEVPVPWGYIHGKCWGNESSLPVLALHGIQHNACSFDRLIPLLPKPFYYVCIDLPGHGKSSSFQEGLPLSFYDYVFSVKKVVDFLKWKKLYIIGHSLGGHLAVAFAALFPERVFRITTIDGLAPECVPPDKSVSHLRRYINNIERINENLQLKSPPSYTFEEAFKRFQENGMVHLTTEAAESLIQRSLINTGSGYRFSTDQRLKLFLKPLHSYDHIKNFITSVQCPVLIILAEDTYIGYKNVMGHDFQDQIDVGFSLNPNFNFIVVKGNHNVHLNNPDRVSEHISKFLLAVKSAL